MHHVAKVAQRLLSGTDGGSTRAKLVDQLLMLLSPDDRAQYDELINQTLPCLRAARELIDCMAEAAQHDGKDMKLSKRLDKAKMAMHKYLHEIAATHLPSDVLARSNQAMADAEAWQAHVWQSLCHASADALQKATRDLAAMAGGGEKGTSWKAKLPKEAGQARGPAPSPGLIVQGQAEEAGHALCQCQPVLGDI